MLCGPLCCKIPCFARVMTVVHAVSPRGHSITDVVESPVPRWWGMGWLAGESGPSTGDSKRHLTVVTRKDGYHINSPISKHRTYPYLDHCTRGPAPTPFFFVVNSILATRRHMTHSSVRGSLLPRTEKQSDVNTE